MVALHLPISLTPCIKKLPITVSICGEAVLEQRSCGSFILTQELLVKVPLEITIRSDIGSQPPCCGRPIAKWPKRPRYKNKPNVIIG